MDRDIRAGLYAGLATYLFWGFAPAYFVLLAHVAAPTIIAHRVIWAALILVLFLLIRDGRALPGKLRLSARQIGGLCLSGALIGGNWLIFIWAVAHQQIIATSLGYFINPLISVLLGMVFLSERLYGPQWLAVAIAAASTLYLAVFIGEPPWIALSLAFSFGFYGLVRKRLDVGPMVGLLGETALLLPLAIVYLAAFAPAPAGDDDRTLALLIGSGLVTVLPLVGFNYAAKRLSLAAVGFLQYLAPSISFCLAVFIYREPLSTEKLVAFVGIWIALIIFTGTSLHREHRRRRTLIEAEAALGPPNQECFEEPLKAER